MLRHCIWTFFLNHANSRNPSLDYGNCPSCPCYLVRGTYVLSSQFIFFSCHSPSYRSYLFVCILCIPPGLLKNFPSGISLPAVLCMLFTKQKSFFQKDLFWNPYFKQIIFHLIAFPCILSSSLFVPTAIFSSPFVFLQLSAPGLQSHAYLHAIEDAGFLVKEMPVHALILHICMIFSFPRPEVCFLRGRGREATFWFSWFTHFLMDAELTWDFSKLWLHGFLLILPLSLTVGQLGAQRHAVPTVWWASICSGAGLCRWEIFIHAYLMAWHSQFRGWKDTRLPTHSASQRTCIRTHLQHLACPTGCSSAYAIMLCFRWSLDGYIERSTHTRRRFCPASAVLAPWPLSTGQAMGPGPCAHLPYSASSQTVFSKAEHKQVTKGSFNLILSDFSKFLEINGSSMLVLIFVLFKIRFLAGIQRK